MGILRVGGSLPQGVLAGAWKLPEQGVDRQFELFRLALAGPEAGAYHTFPREPRSSRSTRRTRNVPVSSRRRWIAR